MHTSYSINDNTTIKRLRTDCISNKKRISLDFYLTGVITVTNFSGNKSRGRNYYEGMEMFPETNFDKILRNLEGETEENLQLLQQKITDLMARKEKTN